MLEGGSLSKLIRKGADYRIIATMDRRTFRTLEYNEYYLYGFKAVQGTGDGGRPLVWLKTQDYSMGFELSWSGQYDAYISNSRIATDAEILMDFSRRVSLGQTLNVFEGGLGAVVNRGPATAFSIHNTSDAEFTCGIANKHNKCGAASPVCAFALSARQDHRSIVPREKIFLMFSTRSVRVGTAIEGLFSGSAVDWDIHFVDSYTSGILIDLSQTVRREVAFDMNRGWSWNRNGMAASVAPNTNLVPLLIENATARMRGAWKNSQYRFGARH